jgi:hypothetical protein
VPGTPHSKCGIRAPFGMSPTRVEVIPIPVDLSRPARLRGRKKWGRVTPNLKLPEQMLTEPAIRT